jgi:hypothetical protein
MHIQGAVIIIYYYHMVARAKNLVWKCVGIVVSGSHMFLGAGFVWLIARFKACSRSREPNDRMVGHFAYYMAGCLM